MTAPSDRVGPRRGTALERLVRYLTDDAVPDPLGDELSQWMAGSTRFRTFADLHRDKIRKKLRGAVDAEARRDVRAELRVAHLLLADPRLEIAFETYGARTAGPDFTVTFRGERPFNLEVTRLRRKPDESRIGGAVLTKLRQLPPSVPNVLLIAIEGDQAAPPDVGAATRALRDRADARDDDFFTGRAFEGSRGFYQRFLRLGAVLVWADDAAGDARATRWINRSARIAVPERALRSSVACLRAP